MERLAPESVTLPKVSQGKRQVQISAATAQRPQTAQRQPPKTHARSAHEWVSRPAQPGRLSQAAPPPRYALPSSCTSSRARPGRASRGRTAHIPPRALPEKRCHGTMTPKTIKRHAWPAADRRRAAPQVAQRQGAALRVGGPVRSMGPVLGIGPAPRGCEASPFERHRRPGAVPEGQSRRDRAE